MTLEYFREFKNSPHVIRNKLSEERNECLECGATKGSKCRGPRGGERSSVHDSRLEPFKSRYLEADCL